MKVKRLKKFELHIDYEETCSLARILETFNNVVDEADEQDKADIRRRDVFYSAGIINEGQREVHKKFSKELLAQLKEADK